MHQITAENQVRLHACSDSKVESLDRCLPVCKGKWVRRQSTFLETEVVPLYTYAHPYECLFGHRGKLYTLNFVQNRDYAKILYHIYCFIGASAGAFDTDLCQ